MRVYIVEDSPFMVERIMSKLESIQGVDVVGISDDEEDALRKIRDRHPDFCIVDIRLKSGSGINLLEKIKIERPETTVAILTSYSTPEFFDKCMDLGADYFFDKAKDFDNIENAVIKSKLRLEPSLYGIID